MDVAKVQLTPAQEKAPFLITFYAKVLDSRVGSSILHDTFAAAAANRIAFDFNALKVPKGASVTVPLRGQQLDGWTREFLAAHASATVLHLGCGLDSRVFRVDPAPTVRWYEVDAPEVIELRRRVYPERHDCLPIGSSLADLRWLDGLPTDRPVLVVAEGVVMYLTERDGLALFNRITKQFRSGQLIFDAYSSVMVRSLALALYLSKAGVSLHWAINDPRKLERQVRRLKLATELPFLPLPELGTRLGHNAIQRWIARTLMSRSIRHLRYEF